jgi:hypothetical protein
MAISFPLGPQKILGSSRKLLPYLGPVLTKFGFRRHIFRKKIPQLSNLSEIRPAGTEHVDGWTDRHDEANKRFSRLHERAYKCVYFAAGQSVKNVKNCQIRRDFEKF